MIRTLAALLAIVAVGLPAHAWKNYGSADRFDTECRTPNNGVGCIIEAEQVYVRPSTEGAAPKKLSLVKKSEGIIQDGGKIYRLEMTLNQWSKDL